MGAIEPGEKFTIEYGNGHKLEVMALSFRQRHALAKMCDRMIAVKGAEQFEIIEEALRFCVPGMKDELPDVIDDITAAEIIRKVRMGSTISDEERKKSD